MNVPVEAAKPRRKPLRLFVVILAMLAALAVPAGLYLPDFGLRWGVTKGLAEMGWSQASVNQARLSLWKGDIAIRGMQAASALGEALGIDGIDLNFRWKPLLDRRVWLEQVSLDKAEVVLSRDGAGWRINGLPLPGSGKGEPAQASDWGYGITALTLTDSVLRIEDGALRVVVAVERLDVRDVQSWNPLALASLSLQGRINGAPVDLRGTFRPFAANLDFTADVDLRGLDTAPFAQWGGLTGWRGALTSKVRLKGDLGGKADMAADGRIEFSNGAIPLEGNGQVRAKSLIWQGRLAWANGLKAAGTLEAADLSFAQGLAAIAATAVHADLTRASMDGRAEILEWSGSLSAKGWDMTMDGLRIRHGQLAWTGDTYLNLSAKAKTLFQANGKADGAETVIVSGPWRLAAAKTEAEGEFAHERPEGLLPPLAATMTLNVDGLSVHQGDRQWLAADQARLRGLELSPKAVTLARLDAKAVSALARDKLYNPRLRAGAVTLERLRVSPQGDLEVASLSLAQPVLRLNRDHTGLQGFNDLKDKNAPAGGDAAMPRLALGQLHVNGGQVEFRDRSTTDPVRVSVSNLALDMAAIDSAYPERDSSFTLAAAIGAAELSAQGAVRPFQPIPGLDAKGRVRALDLPQLSPYAADALGVNLHTGQLDAQVAMALREGKLDGRLDLVLSRLTIAQPDPNAPLAKQADMPIETVLDLLRDGQDRISLAIPVKGDLDNPNFDTSDAVNQAIGGALKSTVFTTLKVAFPLVGLIGLVLDEAEKPVLALQAVSFADGSSQVSEPQAESLKKISGLLAERDGIRLNLCGVAVTAKDGPVLRSETSFLARLKAMMADKDREELAQIHRDRLYRLAEARAVAVKSWLVGQGGIDQGRLFTCRPRIDDVDKAAPRVDLVL
ncbi:AsmA family protein [Magnetospirillum gryphiswaldense MSR-1]|uniref:DUF748 domain-containing protein n=2 Tax=Magnetospirillum gryphiswaldense TaxID=55518 RepID=A4TZM9_9PROT|nr:AsmA family protein [Magnetospirillum gryphiswaldense MSR-1]AVM78966.1 AsmA family protein [Magnetospirillum gryphiswaldense]CAM76086.1 conserved hypothetical protein, secreted [Magnetospirillum gryphiswaldense MSR-1]